MTSNELMNTLGKNIRRYRLEKSYTQEQLAELVGISTPFYANLERGAKGVSIYVLRKIADTLEVSVDNLLYDDCPDSHLHNVITLLRDKPESFVSSMEKMIRLCDKEFAWSARHHE